MMTTDEFSGTKVDNKLRRIEEFHSGRVQNVPPQGQDIPSEPIQISTHQRLCFSLTRRVSNTRTRVSQKSFATETVGRRNSD